MKLSQLKMYGERPLRECRANFANSMRPSRASVDCASVALEMGYTNQSHMIAEFRLFSGLTRQTLASHEWFHPFIIRTRNTNGLVGMPYQRDQY
jgi:hypothetical protein